ncbi:hypothetical protein KFU94_07145 [Chloroflexi bacterium TSY]|nr:hypothetical protein [Chloroflexi bacterium TSY]
MLSRSIRTAIASFIGFWVLIRFAFGYIDPNTGGMLFQLLAAIFASLTGILLFFYRYVQMFMARVKRIFRGVNGQEIETSGSSDTVEN